jgi:methionyl aminopeptidase
VVVKLKSAKDISGIYRSGQIAGRLLDDIAPLIVAGVTTAELDAFGAEYIRKHGGAPAFLGYNGFPGNLCISLNEQVVHGIPGSRRIAPGDLVSVDVGVIFQGYISDTARTYFAGTDLPPATQRLMDGTRTSLDVGIAAIETGIPLRLVSRAIEMELRRNRLGIVRELTGHGTGFELHEHPTVYNFDPGTRRPLIENGLVIAIEPMATLGGEEIELAADKWAYLTADGSLAAHYEHTVVCWDGRGFVLTDPHDHDAREAFGGHGS